LEKTWWIDPAQLDDEQKQVIKLPNKGSFLVKGPPGSGKTNLLALRANYLTHSGISDLAVIVFNRTLCEFLRSGGVSYKFDPKKIVTGTQFTIALLAEVDSHIEKDSQSFKEFRSKLAEELSKQIKLQKIPKMHNVILLDEAQDYLPIEIENFSRLADDLFVVADPRQKIYGGSDPMSLIEGKVEKIIELHSHYRNGLEICKLADQVGSRMSGGYDPIEPSANYPESAIPSRWDHHPGLDLSQQADFIADTLKLERRAFPDELLGVLCPRLAEVGEIAKALSSRGLSNEMTVQLSDDGYQAFDPDRMIWVSTIHSGKGLEFRTLHIAALEYISRFRDRQKKLVYTAITRAKTSLDLYHDGHLPPYLQGAIDHLRTKGTKASIEQAFGR
jgi:superfamily I DNA/RNA helicase